MSITGFPGQHPLVRRPPGKHHSFHTLAVRPCCAPVRAGGCQGLWRAVRRLKHPTCLVRNVYHRLPGPVPACPPPAGQAPQFLHLSRAPLLCAWMFGAKIFRGTKVPVPCGQSTGNLQYQKKILEKFRGAMLRWGRRAPERTLRFGAEGTASGGVLVEAWVIMLTGRYGLNARLRAMVRGVCPGGPRQ